MIATVSSSDLSWLIWELVISALAGLGGLVVWRGLWLEKHSKPKGELYSNLADFRRGQLREKSGENWVIVGIVVEIIVAVLLAASDGWDIHKINKSVAKNDPQKQPIFSFSAYACVVVRPLEHLADLDDTNLIGMPWAENAALFPYKPIS